MPSRWLEWQKARFRGQDVPDYLIDDDGTFYCCHNGACNNLAEHEARKAAEPRPIIPGCRANP